ncbi:MAG TPA: response regulator transcription factor, partial [Clostridiaceae bacterium]|nr:response regulator transcription factor [Clostridiaceae bacterium]
MNKISVLIADDHSMVRQGLKQILELEDDITVIAQAS